MNKYYIVNDYIARDTNIYILFFISHVIIAFFQNFLDLINNRAVCDYEIKIRDILNMTILVDHDIIDGTLMGRFLNDLNQI